jgi:hypothetical protein
VVVEEGDEKLKAHQAERKAVKAKRAAKAVATLASTLAWMEKVERLMEKKDSWVVDNVYIINHSQITSLHPSDPSTPAHKRHHSFLDEVRRCWSHVVPCTVATLASVCRGHVQRRKEG